MPRVAEQYLRGLSEADRRRQRAYIERSRRQARRGIYEDRPKLKSYTSKPSVHTTDFARRYGFSVQNVRRIERELGVPVSTQKEVLRKGRGAYFSSGSRPDQTKNSWAYARLASTLLGRKACRVDAHLLPQGVSCARLRQMAK